MNDFTVDHWAYEELSGRLFDDMTQLRTFQEYLERKENDRNRNRLKGNGSGKGNSTGKKRSFRKSRI